MHHVLSSVYASDAHCVDWSGSVLFGSNMIFVGFLLSTIIRTLTSAGASFLQIASSSAIALFSAIARGATHEFAPIMRSPLLFGRRFFPIVVWSGSALFGSRRYLIWIRRNQTRVLSTAAPKLRPFLPAQGDAHRLRVAVIVQGMTSHDFACPRRR